MPLNLLMLLALHRFYCHSAILIQEENEPLREKTCFTICEQQRRRSICVSAQSDQRLCCSRLSIIPILAKSKISRLKLVSVAAQGFESYLVANPEDMFSPDVAQIITPHFMIRLFENPMTLLCLHQHKCSWIFRALDRRAPLLCTCQCFSEAVLTYGTLTD